MLEVDEEAMLAEILPELRELVETRDAPRRVDDTHWSRSRASHLTQSCACDYWTMIRARSVLSVVATLYLVALIWLAFVPRGNMVMPSEASAAFQFALVSVLLVLVLGRRRWWVALGFAVLGASWIEAAQSVWMPPGYALMTDAIAGTIGATVGTLVTVVALRISRNPTAPAPVTEPK